MNEAVAKPEEENDGPTSAVNLRMVENVEDLDTDNSSTGEEEKLEEDSSSIGEDLELEDDKNKDVTKSTVEAKPKVRRWWQVRFDGIQVLVGTIGLLVLILGGSLWIGAGLLFLCIVLW